MCVCEGYIEVRIVVCVSGMNRLWIIFQKYPRVLHLRSSDTTVAANCASRKGRF